MDRQRISLHEGPELLPQEVPAKWLLHSGSQCFQEERGGEESTLYQEVLKVIPKPFE